MNVLVSLRWVVLGIGTEDRCHMRRDNHSSIFAVTGHYRVGSHSIISTVGCDAGNCRVYLIQQRCHLRGIPNIIPGQGRSHDHSGVGIHDQM